MPTVAFPFAPFSREQRQPCLLLSSDSHAAAATQLSLVEEEVRRRVKWWARELDILTHNPCFLFCSVLLFEAKEQECQGPLPVLHMSHAP